MTDLNQIQQDDVPETVGLADCDDVRAEPEAVGFDEVPDGGPRDWRLEYLREVAQSRKYRQRAQGAEAEAERLSELVLTEEQLADYEALRAQAAEASATAERVSLLEDMVRSIAGLNELRGALTACGVGSACPHGDKMLAQAAALLDGRINVDIPDSSVSPTVGVLGEDGEPTVDEDGQLVTVRQFVAQWLAEEGSHFLPASGDTGSGARAGRTSARGVSIEQLDRDPKAKAEFIAKNGPQAYVQLARRRGRGAG